MSPSNIFDIQNLHCLYQTNKPVLHVPELQIRANKVTFILGSSGVGKTSLLQALGLMKKNFTENCVVNFLHFPEGNYQTVWESEEKLVEVRKKYFSFMFQEAHFFNNFSVLDTLRLPNLVAGLDSANNYTDDMVELLKSLALKKLAEHPNKSVDELSVGQKQRVSFIQALQKENAILFADEPTGNVDEINSEKILEIIRKKTQSGWLKGSIIVSHHLSFALEKADDIIVLSLSAPNYGTIRKEHVFRDIPNENRTENRDELENIRRIIKSIYENDWEIAGK